MEKKNPRVITIGLFGTCGNSQWRTPFIEHYERRGIAYFNPVVPNWDESCAAVEAEHLVEDEIILFPVTDETTGFGSLGEVGFSINQAITSNDERFVVVYIAPGVNDDVREADAKAAKESCKARALVLAHLRKQYHKYPNVFVVESLDDMLNASSFLYDAMNSIRAAKQFTVKK